MQRWREILRLSLDEHRWQYSRLAKATGIKEDTLRNWMRTKGDRGQPTIDDAIKIAEKTRLSLDELFRGVRPDDQIQAEIEAVTARINAILEERLRAEAGEPPR